MRSSSGGGSSASSTNRFASVLSTRPLSVTAVTLVVWLVRLFLSQRSILSRSLTHVKRLRKPIQARMDADASVNAYRIPGISRLLRYDEESAIGDFLIGLGSLVVLSYGLVHRSIHLLDKLFNVLAALQGFATRRCEAISPKGNFGFSVWTYSKNCRHECRESASRGIDELFFEDKGSRFSGAANFNATLHCKDTDVIKLNHNPGIWVIEQGTAWDDASEDARNVLVTEEEISSFTNLSASTLYRYKAYRVASNGDISEPETSPWFSTFEIDHQSEEIKDLELAVQTLDDANPSRVRADIIFQPASDCSCHYDVVSWNEDDGLTIGSFESLHDFRFSLRNLDYERNVTVLVSARNMGSSRGSSNVSLTFVTPSCLRLQRNLTLCAPDQLEGLRISAMYQNGSDYDITVAWDEPSFIPDNYTLQIESLDYEDKEYKFITLPGNMTEAVLTIEVSDDDNRQRIISIIAESSGGTSVPVSIHVNLDETLNILSTAMATESGEKKTNSAFDGGIIAVPSVAIVAIVLGTAYAYHLRRHARCKRKDKIRYKYCRNLNDVKKDLDCTFYRVEKIGRLEFERKEPSMPKDRFEIRKVQLTMKTIIGSGASGIVRLGTFRVSQDRAIDVAVKMLKDEPGTDDLMNFGHEISIMKSAGHHPNIVSIIGCCTVDVARPMLIVEYCSRGDLQTYLRTIWQEAISRAFERDARCKIAMRDNGVTMGTKDYENTMNVRSSEAHQVAITNKLYEIQEAYTLDTAEEQITVADLLNFARQVASGMEFLSSNHIIHRDLAARNVLLCEDKTVKISDFGLSRDVYEENVYKKQGNGRLPLKWMAIEALTHQIYTTRSDVWSFGILLWEIVTLGCNPYPETPTNMILQLLKSGYRMEKPENCGNELYDIMLSCWRSTSHSRPNFTQLKRLLDNLLRTVNDNEYLSLYELIREPNSRDSLKLVDKNYSDPYSA